MSTPFALMDKLGHEQIIFCQDLPTEYRAIIAIHSTALVPAVGGTRYWPCLHARGAA